MARESGCIPKRIDETAISVNDAVLMSYQVKEKQTKDKRGGERGVEGGRYMC